jgi:hypothetical protein
MGNKSRLFGCEDLQAWLIAQGFKCEVDSLSHNMNECNWYAYRRSNRPARRCECNNDKEGIPIVIKPSTFTLDGTRHESVTVELCGEANGAWWNIQAYSLGIGEVKDRLGELELGLITAWNALG